MSSSSLDFHKKWWFQFIDYKKDFLSVPQNRGSFGDLWKQWQF